MQNECVFLGGPGVVFVGCTSKIYKKNTIGQYILQSFLLSVLICCLSKDANHPKSMSAKFVVEASLGAPPRACPRTPLGGAQGVGSSSMPRHGPPKAPQFCTLGKRAKVGPVRKAGAGTCAEKLRIFKENLKNVLKHFKEVL